MSKEDVANRRKETLLETLELAADLEHKLARMYMHVTIMPMNDTVASAELTNKLAATEDAIKNYRRQIIQELKRLATNA